MPYGDPEHGTTDIDGESIEVTFKEKTDADGVVTDVLVAPGHVDDIQPGVDHAHAWGQDTESPDHHDVSGDTPLFG